MASVWMAVISSSGFVRLSKKAGRAGVQRAEDVVVLLEGREDRDLDLGRDGEHFPRRGDAVEVRHADVHENEVGHLRPCLPYGGAPVTRLAHDFDRVVAGEHPFETSAHQVVIVDQEHAHAPRAHVPSSL